MKNMHDAPSVVAVNVSNGGIPKLPLREGFVTTSGVIGDGHAHNKHVRSDRALSLLDLEILDELAAEGFAVGPGIIGENLTVAGLRVQQLQPGTRLEIGQVVARLEAPRKPCYVLDPIHPRLKEVVVGRCGYMASVEREGTIRPGDLVRVLEAAPASSD